MTTPRLTTVRLFLREWRDGDLAPFAALNADPEVMRFLPQRLSRAESDGLVERIRTHFAQNGFGLWALERRDSGELIGFTGLAIPRFEAHFTPCVEIGWRLAFLAWGKGFATEAAQAAVEFARDQLQLQELVSITTPTNKRSRRVMERIGMIHDATGDFDHPLLAEGHPLRRHVLYRLSLSRSDS